MRKRIVLENATAEQLMLIAERMRRRVRYIEFLLSELKGGKK